MCSFSLNPSMVSYFPLIAFVCYLHKLLFKMWSGSRFAVVKAISVEGCLGITGIWAHLCVNLTYGTLRNLCRERCGVCNSGLGVTYNKVRV